MTANDILEILSEYADANERKAAEYNLDGARLAAVDVALSKLPDPEAFIVWENLKRAAQLRFVAESARKRMERQDASEAPTPREPYRLSFVDKERK